MVSTPNNPLQAAIYTRLNSFAGLTALIGSNQVFDFVPATAKPPYVLIGDDTITDNSTKTESAWEAVMTLHCWDAEKAGRKSVKSILDQMYAALHLKEVNINISGFSLVQMRFEWEHTMQDPSVQGQGDRWWHGIHRYRALIQL